MTNKSQSRTCSVGTLLRPRSSFVSVGPFAVTTVVRRLDPRIVSNSGEFKSFVLSMRIGTRESTANFLFSGLVLDGAGTRQSN